MDTKVIEMTLDEIKNLKNRYRHSEINYNVQHAHFQIKGSDFTITAYKSGKVVFQAADLSIHLGNEKKEDNIIDTKTMSGSDEVGTGDYFGPVTVCAVYLEEKDYDKLPLDKIRDTKEISDELVYELAPLLIKETKHSLLILNNEKYNFVQQSNNLNEIKAKLHNQAFVHLDRKYGLPEVNIIDQFAPKDLYYRYIKDEKQIINTLIFKTKAENKYLPVACAAIIARYAFLETLRALEEKYDFIFPKGSGKIVDIKGREFVERYGQKELRKVAKLHFKNTERIISEHQD